MPQQRVVQDFNMQGDLVPTHYVLTLQPCEVNWDKPIFHYDALKPSEIDVYDLDPEVINMSIYYSDFIFNNLFPERIGINLAAIKKRIELQGYDPGIIQQFVLSAEIDEILKRLPQQRKMNILLNQGT